MFGPHEVLTELREREGAEQMAVFAEALHMRVSGNLPAAHTGPIAAAYLLGRCDGSKRNPGNAAAAMAIAVLQASYLLEREREPTLDNLPF